MFCGFSSWVQSRANLSHFVFCVLHICISVCFLNIELKPIVAWLINIRINQRFSCFFNCRFFNYILRHIHFRKLIHIISWIIFFGGKSPSNSPLNLWLMKFRRLWLTFAQILQEPGNGSLVFVGFPGSAWGWLETPSFTEFLNKMSWWKEEFSGSCRSVFQPCWHDQQWLRRHYGEGGNFAVQPCWPFSSGHADVLEKRRSLVPAEGL